MVDYAVMAKTCRICKSDELHGREKKNMTAERKEAQNNGTINGRKNPQRY